MGISIPICVLFTVTSFYYARGQMTREITFGDMDQMTSRLKAMNFGRGYNMSSMQLVGGTVKTVKNMVQYESRVQFGSQRYCVVEIVIDNVEGNTMKSTNGCSRSHRGHTFDAMELHIKKLIRKCEALHSRAADVNDYDRVIRVLNLILHNYLKSKRIDLYERSALKFNVFSVYGKVMQELLEMMRLEYVRNDHEFYVQNIDFILQMLRIVSLLKETTKHASNAYSSIKTLIISIMDDYYAHKPLHKYTNNLRLITDENYTNIIVSLIELIENAPPLGTVNSLSSEGDTFEIALRQLVNELQSILEIKPNGMILLKYFNHVLNVYLGNLYVLPSFHALPPLGGDITVVEYTSFINRFFLMIQQQYNKQANAEDTAICIRLSDILQLLVKTLKLTTGMKKEQRFLAQITMKIIWGGTPKNVDSSKKFDRFGEMLDILIVLLGVHAKGAPKAGFHKTFEIILKILTAISNGSIIPEKVIDRIDTFNFEGYEEIIKDLREAMNRFHPGRKNEDNFVIKIKMIIRRLEEMHEDGNPDSTYDSLLAVLNLLLNDYRKNKMLRVYKIEELKFNQIYSRYADIFEEMIKIMESQYTKQGQNKEVTKLILILRIHQIISKQSKAKDEILEIKKILIEIMEDVYDRGQLQKDYIDRILEVKAENDRVGKIIIELIKMLTNMPLNVQRSIPVSEDYFVTGIRQLMVLLQKIHDGGKSDEGFKATLKTLRYILTSYQNNNNTLPDFKLKDLGLHVVHSEYSGVTYKLIQLMEKKYVDQNQQAGLMRMVFVSKIREFILKLGILEEADIRSAKREGREIKEMLLKIMFSLYNHQKLDDDYITHLKERKFSGFRTLIKEVIAYLMTCPMENKGGESKIGKPFDGIIKNIIKQINKDAKNKKLDSRHQELIEMLVNILEAIKNNRGKLPSITDLDLRLEDFLTSGLYDEILIKLMQDLMAQVSVNMEDIHDVSILVKIINLLDWIVLLRKTHEAVGADNGYDALLEALIEMMNDLTTGGDFTRNYLSDWLLFLQKHLEYKIVITNVIGFLVNNCGACRAPLNPTTQPPVQDHPIDQSGGVSAVFNVDATDFEERLRILLEALDILYTEGRSAVHYKEIKQWIEHIIDHFNREKEIAPLDMNDIKLNVTDKRGEYDRIVDKLIGILMIQYEEQQQPKEVLKLKYALEIRSFLHRIGMSFNGDIVYQQEQIRDKLTEIMSSLWNGTKLTEKIIEDLRQYENMEKFRRTISDIIKYLRNLPAGLWDVAVARDDFEAALLRSLTMLKDLLRQGGEAEILSMQIKVVKTVLSKYHRDGNTLTIKKLKLSDVYKTTLHCSTAWRLFVNAIAAQYRKQGETENMKRVEFLLQMQWFVKQTIDRGSQVESRTFSHLINQIQMILNDFKERELHREKYVTNFIKYIRFAGLREIVPNVLYFLTNWDKRVHWIGDTNDQKKLIRKTRRRIENAYHAGQFQLGEVKYVSNIWTGIQGCNCFYGL